MTSPTPPPKPTYEELVEALEPFAREGEKWPEDPMSWARPWIGEPSEPREYWKAEFTTGDLRRARALLTRCRTGEQK